MKSKLIIEHGETTCASKPGKFCRFLGETHFRTVPVCMLFNRKLQEDDYGWIKRCDKCLEEFVLSDKED
jgi:hypothetical protein